MFVDCESGHCDGLPFRSSSHNSVQFRYMPDSYLDKAEVAYGCILSNSFSISISQRGSGGCVIICIKNSPLMDKEFPRIFWILACKLERYHAKTLVESENIAIIIAIVEMHPDSSSLWGFAVPRDGTVKVPHGRLAEPWRNRPSLGVDSLCVAVNRNESRDNVLSFRHTFQ